jgi:predicted transcriptional regulator
MDFQSKLRFTGLSKAGLGRLLGVHRNTASRWVDGPGYAHAYLDLMIEVIEYRVSVKELAKRLLENV